MNYEEKSAIIDSDNRKGNEDHEANSVSSLGDDVWGKSLTYLCLDEAKLVGLLNIRYDLPRNLSEKYGHNGGVLFAENDNYTNGIISQYNLMNP